MMKIVFFGAHTFGREIASIQTFYCWKPHQAMPYGNARLGGGLLPKNPFINAGPRKKFARLDERRAEKTAPNARTPLERCRLLHCCRLLCLSQFEVDAVSPGRDVLLEDIGRDYQLLLIAGELIACRRQRLAIR